MAARASRRVWACSVGFAARLGGSRGFVGGLHGERGLSGRRGGGLVGGVLKLGAEPANEAAFFFRGALMVESDEALQNLIVGEVVGPAVGVENSSV
jgi:hypothetical protein